MPNESKTWVEFITLALDFIGLILVSWYLFSVPNPIVLRNYDRENVNGIHVAHPDIEAALNTISRNMGLILKMRIGFICMTVSMIMKVSWWFKGNLWPKFTGT